MQRLVVNLWIKDALNYDVGHIKIMQDMIDDGSITLFGTHDYQMGVCDLCTLRLNKKLFIVLFNRQVASNFVCFECIRDSRFVQ